MPKCSLELAISIIAASIPALQPIWKAVIHRYRLHGEREMSGYALRTQKWDNSAQIINHVGSPRHDLEIGSTLHASTDSIGSYGVSNTTSVSAVDTITC